MADLEHWIITFVTVLAYGLCTKAVTAQQTTRCKTPTMATQRIEKVIATCQEEIKLAILKEALELLGETRKDVTEAVQGLHRKRRDLFSEEEQRIAGCLLQCVYKKFKAVDSEGYPTVEGLVKLYAEGINERGYFLATAQAVQQCLFVGYEQKRKSSKLEKQSGEMCDLAYKVFDCVSDQLAEYCSGE